MTSLSERYFRPKAAELDGKLYEWLGVLHFKRRLMSLVRVDPDNPSANSYVLEGRSLADVQAFEQRSRRSEIIHVLGLAVAVLLLVLAALGGGVALWLPGAVVFLANFHCFILQRYNRIRVLRVLGRARRTRLRG